MFDYGQSLVSGDHIQKCESILEQNGIAGLVRYLRSTPDFFRISLAIGNSNKIYNRFLRQAGYFIDYWIPGPIVVFEYWIATLLLVLIDRDPVMAGFLAMILLQHPSPIWLKAIATSFILNESL